MENPTPQSSNKSVATASVPWTWDVTDEVQNKPVEVKQSVEKKEKAIKGRPKSGRVWKNPESRASSRIQWSGTVRTSWQKKREERQLKEALKTKLNILKEKQQKQREDEKRRRIERQKRREANEAKATVVQQITNVKKIKKLTKRQLKTIKKV